MNFVNTRNIKFAIFKWLPILIDMYNLNKLPFILQMPGPGGQILSGLGSQTSPSAQSGRFLCVGRSGSDLQISPVFAFGAKKYLCV